MANLFPSILPTGEPYVDNTYTEGEVERMEYSELRGIAADHPSSDVNGKMGKKELRENLVGLERL